MRLLLTLAALVLLVTVLAAGALFAYARATGLQSHGAPGRLESHLARVVRRVAIPGDEKARTNPLASSRAAGDEGLQHFARYCALCHGNDGSGETSPIGGGLYPKPPDLRADATQDLTDGELFYIIEHGVRFTGMPAFGAEVRTDAGTRQTWQLVTFIRRLPRISADELGWMESLNPL